MEFFKDATFEDIVDSDVDVSFEVVEGQESVVSAPLCHTFVKDGHLWVDCDPLRPRQQIAPVPDSARIFRQDKSLTIGRYCIFVQPATELGLLLQRLFDAQQKADARRQS